MKFEILPKMLISSILSHIMFFKHSYATKIYPESEFLTENEKTLKTILIEIEKVVIPKDYYLILKTEKVCQNSNCFNIENLFWEF